MLLPIESEGETALWVVESGTVRISRTLNDGRELTILFCGPGESVLESALHRQNAGDTLAYCHADVTLLRIPFEHYRAALKEFRDFSASATQELATWLESLEDRISGLALTNVECRIRHFLMTLLRRHSAGGETVFIPIRITRKDLAQCVSARLETVIRILRAWNGSMGIRLEREGIHVDLGAGLHCHRCSRSNSPASPENSRIFSRM